MGKEKTTKEFVNAFCQHLEELHELIIRDTGGLEGVRDKGGLYHSSWKITERMNKNDDPFSVASFMFHELAKRHHFNDGNKRTAYCSVKEYLFLWSLHFKLEYSPALLFITDIAKHENSKTLKEIEIWIRENVEEIQKTKDINNFLDILYKDLDGMKR